MPVYVVVHEIGKTMFWLFGAIGARTRGTADDLGNWRLDLHLFLIV